MAIKRPLPGQHNGQHKRRQPRPTRDDGLDAASGALDVDALVNALADGTLGHCPPAYAPTTNLLALAIPPAPPAAPAAPLFTTGDTLFATLAAPAAEQAAGQLAVSISHLASPAEACVPRVSVRLAVRLPSGSGAGEDVRVTLLSWSPDGEQLLVVSSSPSGGDVLTLFEHKSPCLDEGWEVVLQERVGRFGAPASAAEGEAGGKRVVSVRWVGEPRRWYPSPTFPDLREQSKKPLFCAPPRSAPLSGSAFVAVLSSDEILFLSLPSTPTTTLPSVLCMPLHPPPSTLSPSTSSTPLPPGLSLTAVPTPPTPLPSSSIFSLPSAAAALAGPLESTAGPVDGPSPQTTVDALVSSLVSSTSAHPPPLGLDLDALSTESASAQALRDELKLTSAGGGAAEGKGLRREVKKAAIGAARSRGGADTGETVFVVASWGRTVPAARRRREKPAKGKEKEADAKKEPEDDGGLASLGGAGAATVPDFSFDTDSLLADFTSLDEAFGSSTSTPAPPPPPAPAPEVKGESKEEAEDAEDWRWVAKEVDGGEKWRVELTEVRVEMVASEGPRLTLRPQPPLYLSPSPAASSTTDASAFAEEGKGGDPLLTHLTFLGDVSLPHPLSTLSGASASSLATDGSEPAVDLCLLAVTAHPSRSPSASSSSWRSTLSSYQLSHAPSGYALSEAFHSLEGRRLDAANSVETEQAWAGRLAAQKEAGGVVSAVVGWVGGGEWGSFVAAVAEHTEAVRTRVEGFSSVTLEPLNSRPIQANGALANGTHADEAMGDDGEQKDKVEKADGAFYLPGNRLYHFLAISPNGGLLCALPFSPVQASASAAFSFFRPVIAAGPAGRSSDPLTTRLALRLALSITRQSSPSDLTGRIAALGKDDVDKVLIEAGNVLQQMSGEGAEVEGSAVGWELLGVASGVYRAIADSARQAHLARSLLSLVSFVRSFSKTCAPLRPTVAGTKPLPRWEEDTLWPLVGAVGWFSSEFLPSLILPGAAEQSQDTTAAFLLSHPLPLSLLSSALSHASTLKAYLELAAKADTSEVAELCAGLLRDQWEGVQGERWLGVVGKLREEAAQLSKPPLSSFLTLTLPASHYPRASSALSLLRESFQSSSSTLSDGAPPTPPRSPLTSFRRAAPVEAGWDAIRRARLPLAAPVISIGGRQCLRCGRRTLAPSEEASEALAAVGGGAAVGRWRAYETTWEGGCVCGGRWVKARV